LVQVFLGHSACEQVLFSVKVKNKRIALKKIVTICLKQVGRKSFYAKNERLKNYLNHGLRLQRANFASKI
jgi:hypothetical protein